MEPLLDPKHRELEEQLIRAGRDVHMSAALRAKTLAAIGVASVGVTTASTAQASAGSWLASKGGTFWAMSFLGGAGVVGAAVVVTAGLSGQAKPVQPVFSGTTSSETVHAPPVSTPQALEEPAAVELDLSDSDATGSEAKAEAVVSERHAGKGRSTAKPSTLGEELAAIAQVEAALRAGEATTALSYLTEYRRKFPQSQLGLEAEVLTIQALHESGATARARARAETFIQRYPKSPLGARARQYLR